MCFMLYEGQFFIFPVKVLETQVFDISNPKTKKAKLEAPAPKQEAKAARPKDREAAL